MVILEQSDYERLANEIVAGFQQGIPLNDGILKIATDMGLAPAQIKNLVWAANTRTHLELFEKKADAPDRMIEFPVADADYIIRRIMSPPEVQPLPIKTASELDFFSSVTLPLEKVAEEVVGWDEPRQVSPKTAQARKERMLRTMRKAASELEHHIWIEREGYADAIHALAWEMRKLGGQDEFEKDAYAIYGDAIVDILNDTRAVYKHAPVTSEKIASAVERLVDTTTDYFQLLNTAKTHYEEAVKYAQALSWLRDQLGDKL